MALGKCRICPLSELDTVAAQPFHKARPIVIERSKKKKGLVWMCAQSTLDIAAAAPAAAALEGNGFPHLHIGSMRTQRSGRFGRWLA